MSTDNLKTRRSFLEALALGAAAGGLATLTTNLQAATTFNNQKPIQDSDEWFKKIKGTHRVVYDGSTPHDGFPIIWTWAFYLTNNQTGAPDDDITGVCVLRHSAIPYAFNSALWEKYKFGEVFGIKDNYTDAPSLRNTLYEPKEKDFPLPGIDGIKRLQERGAMFCVCDLAMKVYSGMIAQKGGLDATTVYNDFSAAVLPDIEKVPSGVWALERAQKHGCAYIYAGG
ncbi:twin-arginine translocation signal domain-containing protein [Mangrovimonas aestuarii]|uniref:twin-arginine translocation signal domain-containing protein n=1 Tax=Mangrovimonas aestuarii TaxID=3018443 RepID=UPI0023784753|nr:twin-arginine translocation signal domain-containing protein [Mangrovimonas aestuarii]